MRTATWLIALLGLATLLAWRGRPDPALGGPRSPEAYVDRARSFIEAGGLEADCSTGEVRLAVRPDAVGEADRRWFRESWLSQDVERFRTDPDFAWAFLIDDDCRLRGVHPSVHAIELPFAPPTRWRGRLLYGGRATAGILRSRQRTLSLRRSLLPASAAREGLTVVGAEESLVQEGSILVHLGDPARPLVRFFPVGDAVVLERRRSVEGDRGGVLWNGLPIEPGGRLRLEGGDWVHLRSDRAAREETLVFLGTENLETASVVRRRNDSWERTSDDPGLGRVPVPPTSRTQPWLAGVADDVDRALRRLPTGRAAELVDTFDVELGLRRDLQLQLGQRLGAVVGSIAARRGGDREIPAGITVLDARSGDVLALATWPVGSAEPSASGNQNLRRHPVGSATKPFLLAAMVDAVPELADLTVDGHAATRRHDRLFSCRLPVGYQWLEGHPEPLGLVEALEVSCNRFMVEAATLTLAAEPAGPGRERRGVRRFRIDRTVDLPGDEDLGIRIGGLPLAGPPDLSTWVLPADRGAASEGSCGALDRLDQISWRAPLGALTGAATTRAGDPWEASARALRGVDLGPWEPLVEHLAAGLDGDTAWRVRSSFRGSAPEQVGLELDAITRLRADWVSFLLGGGTSTWTNLQLAEATARLVTGRGVEARLASRVLPAGEAPGSRERVAAPLLSLDPGARAPVLEGMRRVVEGDRGTARSLRGPLDEIRRRFPDDRVVLYAKTGSPVVERPVTGADAEGLEQLVVRRRLVLRGDRLEVRSDGRAAPWSPDRGTAARQRFVGILADALDSLGGGARPGPVVDAVDGLARSLEDGERPEGPLVVENGRLALDRGDPFFRRRFVRGLGATLVLALVRVPGDGPLPPTTDELAAADTAAVVAAIHLDTGPGSSVAVEVARALLGDLEPFLR